MIPWHQEFENVQRALLASGAEIEDFHVQPSASEGGIREVEKRLQVVFPPSLRRFLISFSEDSCWRWSTQCELPSQFREISGGGFEFSLGGIEQAEDSRKEWIESCFPNIEDEYDAVWHNKLAFMCAANGDQMAFDLNPANFEKIVYLCHDGCDYHGYVMADNLDDLMNRWLPLGCPGPEAWAWLYFTESATSRILPDGVNGRKWRTFLGLAGTEQNKGGV